MPETTLAEERLAAWPPLERWAAWPPLNPEVSIELPAIVPQSEEPEGDVALVGGCQCKAHKARAAFRGNYYGSRRARNATLRDLKLKRRRMKDYTWSPPNGWTKLDIRKNANPRQRGPLQVKGLYLGVELETSTYESGTLGRSLAIDLARPRNLWAAKPDASISGPEFVSMPATLDYWHGKRTFLARMFSDLIHAGYRSHTLGECGMHVSMSIDALKYGRGQFIAMMGLLAFDQALALAISQRSSAQARQWAAIAIPEDVCDYSDCLWGGFRGASRYTALNIPSWGSGHAAAGERIEFRLPRGTLRLDRYYKNLEWAHSLVAYTEEALDRDLPSEAIDPKRWYHWLMRDGQRRRAYPNLVNFLEESSDIEEDTVQSPQDYHDKEMAGLIAAAVSAKVDRSDD